jgi:hypothetical protein
MFVKPANPKDTVVLVPHSGIQIVDYDLDIDAVGRFQRRFIERQYPKEAVGQEIPVRIFPGWNEDDPGTEPSITLTRDDVEYSINKEKALEPFLGKWVPVPFLRVRHGRGEGGREAYDKGPTNWVRVRIVENPAHTTGQGPRHLAIFAFDTELAPQASDESDGTPFPYTAPLHADAENPREFRLISSMAMLGWFLADPQPMEGTDEIVDYQGWVVEWIDKLFREFKLAQRGGRPLRDEDFPYKLEAAARWFAFLELLNSAVAPQKIRFADTVSSQRPVRPIDVDLVLDVGNSRTCGILVENHYNPDSNVDLSQAHVLELRDVSRPEFVYDEPFESRVELAQAWYGFDHLSRLSGRTKAFFWPSLVRVGPEASRFRSQQTGTEALGGMSSPKRYLWDVSQVNQEWRFPEKDYANDGSGPPIERAVRSFVNSTGDVLSQLGDPRRTDRKLFKTLYPKRRDDDLMQRMGPRLTFSRSSFYTLMLAEIFWQAWVMINSERSRSQRREKATPRRLRRIILTLPPATPVREQRIMMARAQGAIDLIWDLTGWTQKKPPHVEKPTVKVAWDEATCVQFVWLYGQIARNFGGHIQGFFDLLGKPRDRGEAKKLLAHVEPNGHGRDGVQSSLRVASIDIGGGTTDLMIITYFQDDNLQIVPVQTFREGFRIAGDDVVRAIIENVVIPSFGTALAATGAREGRRVLAERFGGDKAGMSEQDKQLRRQFVLRVLEPVALGMIHAYEQAGQDGYGHTEARTVADFLGESGGSLPTSTIAYLEDAAVAAGAKGFNVLDVAIPLDFHAMRSVIISELDKVFDNLAEAIHHFDCDQVLVSGRPSRLPAVMETLTDRLAVSPDRILPLHAYRAGEWYPFRGRDNRSIADPKTAVVVGATLCLLAEHQLQNFRLATDQIQMRSTARFIGVLELGRQLKDENIRFRFSDLEQKSGSTEKLHKWYSMQQFGYRQLPYERWLAAPLYQLSYDTAEQRSHDPMDKFFPPIELVLDREPPDDDPDTPDKRLDIEAAKEDLRLVGATDARGYDVLARMNLTFRTLPAGDSYWLDTGILSVG